MLKKILNFIYSKKINPPYCERTIFGIKITTKPARLSIEYHFNKRLDHLYSYIWDRHCEVNDRFSDIKHFCNKLEKEIIISRSLPKNITNENNPLISIVITVYDIEEKYLRHCLESVINQSYKNIEIIIVNDCSNFSEDEQICLEYASKDGRIKYIKHKENMGDGIARMTGLKEAKGYAVHFMDGDDYLDLSLYEICITYMIKGNVDIVCFSYYIIGEYNDNIQFNFPYYRELMPYTSFIGNEVLDTYCKKNQIIKGYLWNKLFKRELLLKLGFDNIPARYKCKDLNYGFKIFSIANSFIYLPSNLYFYMESRINSFVNRGRNKDTFFTDIYNIFLDLYNFVDKKENDKITELFLSNFYWIYTEALKYDNNDFERNYYLNLLKSLTVDLIRLKVIDKEKFLNKVIQINNVPYFINYAVKLFNEANRILLNEMPKEKIIKETRDTKIIISLTSYPKRIHYLDVVLYSLLNQTIKPDKIILWLSYEEFPNLEGDVPSSILLLKKYGINIEFCKNIFSYKKLIYSLQKYPNDIIITADDDAYYPSDWLEKLYNSYLKNPNAIHCHRCRRILLDNDNNILPYEKWQLIKVRNNIETCSFRNMFTGLGGVLYKYDFLYKDVLNEKLFIDLAPTTDDIWFWAMAVLNGTKINVVNENIEPIDIRIDDDRFDGLWHNFNYTNNDKYIANVVDFYGNKLKDKLIEDK